MYSNLYNELFENEYSLYCYEEVFCGILERMKVDDNFYILVD